jgi:DegV family protein with EDD domain
MGKIKIVTDSTVDMSFEELAHYGIEMVPLSISIDQEVYLDKIELQQAEFLMKMKRANELPKSSQPSVGTFLEVYDRLGKDGSEIISIHMTGGMSGTVQSAESAAKMTESNVTVIDSKFISKALAFQVIEAAQMAKAGHSVAEIVTRIHKIQSQTRLIIVIDSLENLVKGGRIGKVSAFIGSILKIKPIAILDNGVLHPVSKARSQSQIVKSIINTFTEDTENKTIAGIGMVHANGYELANKIKNEVEKRSTWKEIKIEETSPVISTHTGEGVVAIMYYWD